MNRISDFKIAIKPWCCLCISLTVLEPILRKIFNAASSEPANIFTFSRGCDKWLTLRFRRLAPVKVTAKKLLNDLGRKILLQTPDMYSPLATEPRTRRQTPHCYWQKATDKGLDCGFISLYALELMPSLQLSLFITFLGTGHAQVVRGCSDIWTSQV